MYIRCKSCGQLLYIPDDAGIQTVKCPACQTEFLYTPEITPSKEDYNASEKDSNPFDQPKQYTPKFEPVLETATRESYHQARNLTLQPFYSWDAVLTAYRFFSERFGVMLFLAILLPAPYLIMNLVQSAILPELTDIQKTLSEKETLEEVFQEYMAISKIIPPEKAFFLTGINILFSLVNMFLFIGGIRLFNAYGRNQKASVWLVFSGFDSPLRVLIASVLLFLLFLALSVAATFVLFVFAIAGLSFLGVILFFVLFIFFLVYLFFVMPLIADSNLSAIKAFQLSNLIARQNLSTLFGTVSLLLLLSMLFNIFAIGAFGSFLSNTYVSFIAQALFDPILIGVVSAAYLKATGQFRR